MGPAGIRPCPATAGRPALLAHERDGGHAATCLAALARPTITPYPRRIVDRPRLKFLSRVGSFKLPARTLVLQLNDDVIWASDFDRDDVPTIVRYRITAPSHK